jgi:hypothetical protein
MTLGQTFRYRGDVISFILFVGDCMASPPVNGVACSRVTASLDQVSGLASSLPAGKSRVECFNVKSLNGVGEHRGRGS